MNEKLTDYVLDLLSEEEKRDFESHLATSAEDRQELARLQKVLVTMAEAIPSQTPRTTFATIQAKLSTPVSSPNSSEPKRIRPIKQPVKPSSWFYPLALAASLLLAIGSLWWGFSSRQETVRVKAENAIIDEWLSYGDIKIVSLADANNNPLGTVLVSPRAYALFILDTPPPAGKTYQAWGRVNDTITSLAVADSRLIQVNCEGFERIGVSLEPPGGSPQPTQPLGGIPLNYQ
jgi:Anti-sigma-K factor rskA